ncbi:MAG: hypothetical protein QNJ69_12690 [Gammaproteobacteria bacterium]|nr:hypothetical protein [Gammaproteobacteria bacterium]
MTVRAKLTFSFLFMTMLMLVLFATEQFISSKQSTLVQQMVTEHEISAQLVGLSSAAKQIKLYENEYIAHVDNPTMREIYAGQFNDTATEISQFLAKLRKMYAQSGKTSSLNVLAVWETSSLFYTNGFNEVHQKVMAGKITGSSRTRSAIAEFNKGFKAVDNGTAAAIEEQYKLAATKADNITGFQRDSFSIFLTVSGICLALALIMSYWVPASVTKPIRYLTKIAHHISKGKVDEDILIGGSAEYKDLGKSMQRLQITTDGLMQRVKKAKPRTESHKAEAA